MSNLEKYQNAFVEVFGAKVEELNDSYSKETVGEWDSVHQLSLIAQFEESFDIMFDPEDIMEMTSYEKGKELLKKYDVEL
jgi:acyl carrier protein